MVKTYQEKKAYNLAWRKNNPDKIKMYKERYKKWADLTDLPPPPHYQLTLKPKPAPKSAPLKSTSPPKKSKYFGGNT
tara:strand:- start:900 stop:1130 length:231 start_codon:yes stop_codon:yes gene_type:complete